MINCQSISKMQINLIACCVKCERAHLKCSAVHIGFITCYYVQQDKKFVPFFIMLRMALAYCHCPSIMDSGLFLQG
jgi:hypothetical protein